MVEKNDIGIRKLDNNIKEYIIDWEKIKTTEDLIGIVKTLSYTFWIGDVCPEHLQDIYDKKLIKLK